MAAKPVDVVGRIVHRLSTTQKLVNGDRVLIIYYVIILLFFLIDTFLRKNYYKMKQNGPNELNRDLEKFYTFYMRHGFILVNLILFVLCIGLTIQDEGFDLDYLITIILCFVLFTGLMKLFLKLFVNEDSYQSGMLLRYVNVVCYLILGNYFAFFMPFVQKPHLITTFAGLLTGLVVCLYIMIQAIFNPEILRRGKDDNKVTKEALGILKGTMSIVVCILLLEYMMVYSCFVTNGGFYETGEGRVLNQWDMFYYLIISFTTIGYGDIYPVRLDGMFYSEFTAIIIGLTSMFTSACFIAAVISTASSLAQSSNSNSNSGNGNTDEEASEALDPNPPPTKPSSASSEKTGG